MAYMRNIITLLRPHQWLKNLFIFLPLFFSRHLVDWEYIYPCIISFVAYCFEQVVFIVLMIFGMLLRIVYTLKNVNVLLLVERYQERRGIG